MARRAKGPWQRKGRPWWYATINGKIVSLQTTDKEEAWIAWHSAMADKPDVPAPAVEVESVFNVLAKFVAWARTNRAEGTHQWYRWRCQLFVDHIGKQIGVDELRPLQVTEWLATRKGWEQAAR